MKKILLLLLIGLYSYSLEIQQFLEPKDAFKTSFSKQEDSINFKLELGKDIYLYDDKLKIQIIKPQQIDITKELNLPKAIEYHEFIVHFDNLNINIPHSLLKSKIDSNEYEIEVQFQGCSTAGLCYAPMRKKQQLVWLIKQKLIKKVKKKL
jgi:thioredoxin:protein disulfide reductase